MNENSKDELSVKELNGIRRTDFNYYSGCFSVTPKLVLVKPIHSVHPFLVASSPANNCKKIAKDETTQPSIIEDISHLDKTDLESTALPSTGDIQEVVDPKSMPGFLVEKELFVEEQKMVVSMLDSTTTVDDDISLAEKYDKEDNARF